MVTRLRCAQGSCTVGSGFSLSVTGPREGVTQQRVPLGHLRLAGRKPRGGSHLPEQKGLRRTHSSGPRTQPWPLGWASAWLPAVNHLWGRWRWGGLGMLLKAGGTLWSLVLGFLSAPALSQVSPSCDGQCLGESGSRSLPIVRPEGWGWGVEGLWEGAGVPLSLGTSWGRELGSELSSAEEGGVSLAGRAAGAGPRGGEEHAY